MKSYIQACRHSATQTGHVLPCALCSSRNLKQVLGWVAPTNLPVNLCSHGGNLRVIRVSFGLPLE
ncbi:hypothetical protein CY34DRAFT_407100 [Suillus luteus UH-Slu-Lm8-n1]|uniref:Uncharacterized protein n=1 Tax=Suillus luteus UH-Slu-Lm8-n1 TaxID=930992 RepID=A0A0D0AJ56_9AGAM|nr:hypothetical protein CY34DRAFT_407100 [Suillus luteus UH-Slu-Lm8-n1]